MSHDNAIEFKGTGKGLYVLIKPHMEFQAIQQKLIEKLEASKSFFKGAKILDIQCDTLTSDEKIILEDLMTKRYEMVISKEEVPSTSKIFMGTMEGKTKFHWGTLRSGQKINYDGNVVVIGDVNAGAEVIAYGNIIIMGNLRGIAHAGSNGNKEACVAAFSLAPTQLRIADVITRSPDGESEKPSIPEMARIKNNILFIEPYLAKK